MSDVTLRRYVIRSENHEGWAVIVIGSDGYFSTVSDFGNYAYWWGSIGERDFRQFLMGIDDDYLCGKLHPQREYDGDSTKRNIKEHILRYRRDGRMDAETAREEWDLIESEDVENREGFAFWWQKTKIDEPHELASYERPGQVRAFAKRVWPRFAAFLRAELIAEGVIKEAA